MEEVQSGELSVSDFDAPDDSNDGVWNVSSDNIRNSYFIFSALARRSNVLKAQSDLQYYIILTFGAILGNSTHPRKRSDVSTKRYERSARPGVLHDTDQLFAIM